jgi:hypothetical protein
MHVKRPIKTESLRGLFWAKKYRLLEQLHWHSDKGPTDPLADGFSPQSHSISVGTIRPPWHHHSRIYGLYAPSSETQRCHSASQGCMEGRPTPSRTQCATRPTQRQWHGNGCWHVTDVARVSVPEHILLVAVQMSRRAPHLRYVLMVPEFLSTVIRNGRI